MPRKLTDIIYVRVSTNRDKTKNYGRWYSADEDAKRFVSMGEEIVRMSWKRLLRHHSKRALDGIIANKGAFNIEEAIAYLTEKQ